jgi:NGP1NT (NUC091) domain
VQPFDATFGKKRTRKRPRLAAEDMADLAARTTAASDQCAAVLHCCCSAVSHRCHDVQTCCTHNMHHCGCCKQVPALVS